MNLGKKMRLIFLLGALGLGFAFDPNTGFGLHQAKAQGSESSAAAARKRKSTEVSFDDVLVQGKFHFSDEAVTTVEDDKFLDALLTVRKDFKDRIQKSSARH